jgi:curved DNA-binding protein CbpA
VNKQAFRILGIAPTEDGRAIRAAFLRLARIYHPDRFVDMPDDVRGEAERRMKEATIAYESLRAAKSAPKAEPDDEIDEAEVAKRALKFREVAARQREKEKLDRERWSRWEKVEEIARKRAKLESDMAARVADEVDGSPAPGGSSNGSNGSAPKEPRPVKAPKPTTRETLASRLDAARRGETSPLVKRN